MGELRLGQAKDLSDKRHENIDQYRPGYQLQITKKLNPLAYIVLGSIYTLAIVMTTLHFAKDDKAVGRGFSYSEAKIKDEILNEIKKITQAGLSPIAFDQKMNNQLEKFRSELIEEINRVNIKYIEMAQNNTARSDKPLLDIPDRSPAGLNKTKGKMISYSQANSKVLYFLHQKEIKRAEEFFSEKKSQLLGQLDLSNKEDQKKLKRFDDEVELALYELKQKQYQQRRDFEQKKYIVVDSKY